VKRAVAIAATFARLGGIGLGIGLAATPARADDVARRVADANLEPIDRRRGWMIGAAFGGGIMLGLGLPEATGFAAGLSLRGGTSAGPDLHWMVQLDTTAYLAENALENLEWNRNTALTVAGQLYLRESMWAKLGFGLATFSRGAERGGEAPREELSGLSAVASVGYDITRRGGFFFDLESVLFACLYDTDIELSSAMLVGVNWY
jgi:hypothetical protein